MSDSPPPENGGRREPGRHSSRGRQNITGGSTAGAPLRRGASGPSDPNQPLPPELDPRGRRAAHARIRASARAAKVAGAGDAAAAGGGGPTRGRDVARGAILATKIVAAALSLTVVIASYFVWSTWSDFSSSIATGDPIAAFTPVAGSSGPTPSAAPTTKGSNGPDQNILLLGNDSRAGATAAELRALNTGDDGGSSNTDTMMLMHLPGDGSAASVMSFPRDSYVDIPGHGKRKLNEAYPDGYNAAKASGASEIKAQSGGIQLLAQTLQELTGLTIQHYVEITLLGFYRISNAIGGVPVVLCQPQKDIYSGINLPAGRSVISGTQGLAFVRQRHGLPLGDLDRINRQQYFLRSTFHQMLDAGTLLNIFKVQSLLKAVSKSLLVDPGLDLLKLASTFASMAEGNLNLQTIPTDGFDNNTPVGDVVVVNPAEVQAFAANLVGTKVDSKISSAPTVSPATVNVVVLNASNADGIATTNANALKVLGFKATVGNNTAGTTVTTEIEYTNGMQSQAKTLAAQVPGAKLVETSLVKTVTLRLGTDGLQVKSLRTTSGASATKTTTTPAVVVPVGTGRTGVPNQPGCIN